MSTLNSNYFVSGAGLDAFFKELNKYFELNLDGNILKLTKPDGSKATIDLSKFAIDGMLDKVEYDKESNKITFTWNTDDKQKITVDLSDLAEVYEAGDGLKLEGNVFSVDTIQVSQVNGLQTTLSSIGELISTEASERKSAVSDLKNTKLSIAAGDQTPAGSDGNFPLNGKVLKVNSEGKTYWGDDNNTTYSNASTTTSGLMSADDKKKLNGIASGANNYTLPFAQDNVLGGIKTGYSSKDNNYAVDLDNNNQAFVNVPWTDKKVYYTSRGSSGDYPLLFADSTDQSNNTTAGVSFNTGITINPYTSTLKATNFSGTATKAAALNNTTTIGSTTQGVYFDANGKPQLMTYSLAASVPSDAKFTDTDTTYDVFHSANDGAAIVGYNGLVPAHSSPDQTKYLNAAGYWGTPVGTTYSAGTGLSLNGTEFSVNSNLINTISGKISMPANPQNGYVLKYNTVNETIEWAKDNNTTYTLSSFGITATADELNKLDGITASTTELNYVDGVTSSIQTQLNSLNNNFNNYAPSAKVDDIESKINDLGDLAMKDIVEKTDLSTAVQASLNKADSALQNITKNQVTTALGYTPPKQDTNTTYTIGYNSEQRTVGLSADGGETFNSSIKIPYSIIHDTPNLSVYATKASLAEVATSGSYSDLSNKPTIPSVYNPTITIQRNNSTIDSFTLNQSTNKTINISVPTSANDIGAITNADLQGYLDDYAKTSDVYQVVTPRAPHAVLAGPTSGVNNASATFRTLVAADIPDLSGTYATQTDLTAAASEIRSEFPSVYNTTISFTRTSGGAVIGSFTTNQSNDKTINLSVPPYEHASSGTDYGVGSSSYYGHVKLSDEISSTSGTGGGIAATPYAVKKAYDKAVSADDTAAQAFAEVQGLSANLSGYATISYINNNYYTNAQIDNELSYIKDSIPTVWKAADCTSYLDDVNTLTNAAVRKLVASLSVSIELNEDGTKYKCTLSSNLIGTISTTTFNL